ncbi:hypothetical protein [Kosakonia cowanii]|uniref:hypothetical protein n=1 Tax=Kosakonia cowanii TaxID=208223 RepID=UPI004062A18A
MNYIKKSLALSTVVSKKMTTNDPQRLEEIKDRLKSRFGNPIGLHMTGIPLGISTVLAIFCYAMPLVAVSTIIIKWLMIPEYKVLAGVFFAAIAYTILIVTTMFATARGSLTGYKLYLSLITLTGMVAVIFFCSSFFSLLVDNISNYTPQITSLLGILFLLLNCKWLNSTLFYRSVALCLHNRVWRKQMKIQEQNHLR